MRSSTSGKTGQSMGTFVLCLLLMIPGSATYSRAGDESKTLTEEEKIVRVLNRLGFGPRPGDIEKVAAMGLEAYIEQQLHPQEIPDPGMEKRLSTFETLTMTPQELSEFYPAPNQLRRQRLQAERQDQGAQSSPEMEGESAPEETREMQEARRQMRAGLQRIRFELSEAKIMRAVYSERQLQEVMSDFWMNHFNVFLAKGLDRVYTTDFEENVVRPLALGKFEDLLMATAKSPAMLFYLDNWISTAPAEVMEERVSALRSRLRSQRRNGTGGQQAERALLRLLQRAKGLNENYARELMELHTLGVDGGYSQEDVIQVAKCLTGWTIAAPRQGGSFQFRPVLHEDGNKVVLGHRIRSGGIEEGEQVLRMLANHPSTARFISTKLVRRFVADDPPADLVDAASLTFEKTGGDLREVLRTLFTHPHFFSPEIYQAKIKKPLELVASSLRASGAEMKPAPHLMRMLAEMGEALYMCQAPTGYPDVASAWINTNSLLKRLNFALALASDRIPQIRVDLASAWPLFQQLRLPEPSVRQLEQTRSLMGQVGEERNQRGDLRPDRFPKQVIASAFMLGSPQFQKR